MKIPSRSDGSTRDSSGQFTSDDSHERRAQEALTLEAQLTGLNAQPKWTFGSTHHGDDTEDFQPLSGPQGPDRKNPLLDESSRDEHSLDALAAPNHQTGGTSEEILPVNTDQIATISLQHSHQDGSSAGNYDEGSAASDDFEVKDYGYGFGDVSGSEHALEIIRQQKLARERQRIWDNQQRIAAQEQERERERAREMLESERERKEREWEKELEHFRDQDKVTNRPRRGSFSGSYSNYDRGNYRGRRGRGFGGRGYGNRYPGRGGYHQQRPASMSHVTPPPFRVNPVAHLANHVSTYSQPSLMEGYISPTLDPYLSMPVPLHPQSLLTLPIAHSISPFSDNTRTYLLSQLEYYLSPQNMAQDFFLRQRMDDSGWIPISLLASFNRVRNLTTDTTLVAEVLQQSNVVEVDGEFVRMSGQQWEQFILPRQHKALSPQPAPASTEVKMQGGEDDHSNQPQEPDCEADDTDCYVDDEDEEDVVFVIGEEAEGSWLPERRQL
ncbi:hypothetical protein BJ138DRAFT_1009036 [Hygrophoropsis aurantiaca]|uniref:Uncharacterized protein n=1 Tax=Hygrophoropsis aurantiaca TaxID=72124 RepID=A0ACB8ABF0_9AGAM|nr:hypothetical protein BJ138DRAFT_1009036 [Hygrophoropsis aurantiaca]